MLTRYRTAAVLMLMLLTPLAVSADVTESRQEAASVDPYAGFNGRHVADRTQYVQPRTRVVLSRVTYVNRSTQPQRVAYARDTRARIVRNPAYHQPATTYIQVDESGDYVRTPSDGYEEYVIPSRTSHRGSYYSSPRIYTSYRSYGYYGGYPSYGYYGGYPSHVYSRDHGGHYGYGSHYGHRRHSFSYGVSYGHYGGHHSGYGHHYGGHHYGSGVSIYFRF